MPSTVRVNIAQLNSANVITEDLDDVWNTQRGRHATYTTRPDDEQFYDWPTTGETAVYAILTSTAGCQFTFANGVSKWTVNVPSLGVKVRLFVPQAYGEGTTSFSLYSSAAAEAAMIFV